MQKLQIAAGCKRQIVRRQFSSLVTTYTFDAAPILPNSYLTGTVEIKGSNWIFPKSIERVPLQPSNTVTAGVWDTFFSIYVIPEIDVVISLPSKSFGGLLWLIGLVVFVVGVAIALLLLT